MLDGDGGGVGVWEGKKRVFVSVWAEGVLNQCIYQLYKIYQFFYQMVEKEAAADIQAL